MKDIANKAAIGLLAVVTASSACAHGGFDGYRDGVYDSALAFDKNQYTSLTITIDGQPMAVRWYKEICYVARPQLMAATQVGFGGPVTIANPIVGDQAMTAEFAPIYVDSATLG